jgi:hypothetical protein
MEQGSIVIQAKIPSHPEYIDYLFSLVACHLKNVIE